MGSGYQIALPGSTSRTRSGIYHSPKKNYDNDAFHKNHTSNCWGPRVFECAVLIQTFNGIQPMTLKSTDLWPGFPVLFRAGTAFCAAEFKYEPS